MLIGYSEEYSIIISCSEPIRDSVRQVVVSVVVEYTMSEYEYEYEYMASEYEYEYLAPEYEYEYEYMVSEYEYEYPSTGSLQTTFINIIT